MSARYNHSFVGRVAFVRPQKVAGTFLAEICHTQCGMRSAGLTAIEPLEQVLSRSKPNVVRAQRCHAWCYSAWDTHHEFSAIASINGWLAERGRSTIRLFTMLRHPLARVPSEHAYAMAHIAKGLGVEQWDYTTVPHLWRRMLRHNFSLAECLIWPQNPAMERLTRYLAGFKRVAKRSSNNKRRRNPGLLQKNLRLALHLLTPPTDGEDADAIILKRWPHHESVSEAACDALPTDEIYDARRPLREEDVRRHRLERPQRSGAATCPYDSVAGAAAAALLASAKAHLEDERNGFAFFGLAERMSDTLLLLRHHLGWRVEHEPSRKKRQGKDVAVVIPPPPPPPPPLPEALRWQILRRNPLDSALYEHAARLFERRLLAIS